MYVCVCVIKPLACWGEPCRAVTMLQRGLISQRHTCPWFDLRVWCWGLESLHLWCCRRPRKGAENGCSFCQPRPPKIHIGLRARLPPGMGSTAHTSSPKIVLAQSTMLYRIHHHLVNICLPHFITQAPYISRRDHNLKLCSWGNNRLIQVLLSLDNSHLESPTSHCSYCPNSRCFPGGRPSCHQRVRTSCRFQDAVNLRSMVFTRTSLVFTVNRTYTLFCCHSAPSPAVTAHPIPV